MKNEIWLKNSVDKLESESIATARLDCLILLEDVTCKDRGWLLAHPEFELDKAQLKRLDDYIKRRANHEPLAYIRNKTEFYGREFFVDYRVLEPRPESEAIIELLKNLPEKFLSSCQIIDIGTGSGALAITAKLEICKSDVLAIDIDKHCLDVAIRNSEKYSAGIKYLHGNLLGPVADSINRSTVLLCNLPYVPDNFHINPAAMNEPRIAIFGGMDGLDVYRSLFQQIKVAHSQPTYILAESMPPQHEKLATIAKAAGYSLEKTDDFIQQFRADLTVI